MKKNRPKSAALAVPPSPAPASKRGLRWPWLVLGLILLAAHVAYSTWHTDQAAQAFNHSTIPANTIAGVPEPRFFTENDSYAWLAHVRDLMNSGGWRLRWTHMDNAPAGREMHWSHLLIWTLRGLATAIMAATGWPAARAVELAGVWVMPLFEFLFLAGAGWAVARKLGLGPAAGLVFVFLTFECVSIAFYPLEPDHHAFQFFFILAAFVCLQFGGLGWTRGAGPSAPAPHWLGWPATPTLRESLGWFIASGVFGGLALWVGATVWLIALAIIALALIPVLPLFHSPQKDEIYAPTLWRWWTGAGIFVGLICYLLEYAPHHFAMRLEVNHPLYWVSWFGVALGLERISRLRRPLALDFASTWQLAGAGLLALALPLAVCCGPDAWHQMHDPFLKRLHAKYITEFLTSALLREGDVADFLSAFRGFPLALPWAAGWLLLRRARTPQTQRLVATGFAFAGLFLAAALAQQRWGYCFSAAVVWLMLLLLADLFAAPPGRTPAMSRILGGILSALILLDGAHSIHARLQLENGISTNAAIPQNWIEYNLKKRNALQWGLAAGTNQWRFVGMATMAPLLYYYAGIPSVASYYWENAAGWQAEATLLADAAPQAECAQAIARERGITHVVAVLNSTYPPLYLYVAEGLEDPRFAALHTLDGRLSQSSVASLPSWLAIDAPLSKIGQGDYVFKTPSGFAKERLQFQVFSVQPDAAAAPPGRQAGPERK